MQRQEEHSKSHLIPNGETKCIWMTAGVIDYKLCDYEFNCDDCPFDRVMRKSNSLTAKKKSQTERSNSHLTEISGSEKNKNIERALQTLQDFHIRKDFYYHPNHTWVAVDNEGMLSIGIDDFAQKIVISATMVVLPTPGVQLYHGQACCWIVRHYGTLPIVAPLDGSVVAVNAQLSGTPNLLNKDPYGKGWLLKIKPENLQRDLKRLFYGEAVLTHYRKDAEKLWLKFESALGQGREEVGQTLFDGGKHLAELQDMLGPRRYFEIIRTVFR